MLRELLCVCGVNKHICACLCAHACAYDSGKDSSLKDEIEGISMVYSAFD